MINDLFIGSFAFTIKLHLDIGENNKRILKKILYHNVLVFTFNIYDKYFIFLPLRMIDVYFMAIKNNCIF